jgi:hypothetical protein
VAAIVLVPGVDRPRAPRVTEMPVRPRMRVVMNEAAVAVSDVGHPGQIVPKVAPVVAPSHQGRGDLALGNIVGRIFYIAAAIAAA